MAVKTITIDLDAYEILARRKGPGQSFSQVIKEHFGKKKTAGDLLAALERLPLSEETLEKIERQVERRKTSPARVPKL